MKIKQIDVFQLDLPYSGGIYLLSGGREYSFFDSTIVRVLTDSGIEGWGESTPQGSNLKLGIRSEYINVVNKKSENTVEANINLVEDFGNYKLISATNDNIQIKVKVKRESIIPEDKILLEIPPEHCCIYNNEELVE